MANIIRFGGGGGASKKKLAIEKLTEGTIVRIKEKGVEQDYYLAQHDYQPSLNGSGRVLFARKEGYGYHVWNSSANSTYANSTIDTFLNGDFKTLFDADVREAMGETSIPNAVGYGNSSVTTLQKSVFLLSVTELGKSHSNASVEGEAVPIADMLDILNVGGEASAQWTRTPYNGGTGDVWWISSVGTLTKYAVATGAYGIRPCFTLPNTATVLPEANLDGSYTLSLGDDDPTQQYFKLTVVDGTTQPENPAENTIWVNTDVDMGMCYLAPNAPENPEVGDVWVNTTNKYNSNGTNASTNLIRVNDNPYLEINVLNISQWDGSAWVTRENSAIYANGAWTTMALWLYNYGTLGTFEFKAGGMPSNHVNKTVDDHRIGITYAASYMSIPKNYYDESACSTIILTTTPVDFSKYNKLTVEYAVGASYEGRVYSSYVGFTYVANPSTYQSASSSLKFQSLATGQKVTTTQTVEVDLSLRTGICYPALQLPGEMSMAIYKWVFTA